MELIRLADISTVVTILLALACLGLVREEVRTRRQIRTWRTSFTAREPLGRFERVTQGEAQS